MLRVCRWGERANMEGQGGCTKMSEGCSWCAGMRRTFIVVEGGNRNICLLGQGPLSSVLVTCKDYLPLQHQSKWIAVLTTT